MIFGQKIFQFFSRSTHFGVICKQKECYCAFAHACMALGIHHGIRNFER